MCSGTAPYPGPVPHHAFLQLGAATSAHSRPPKASQRPSPAWCGRRKIWHRGHLAVTGARTCARKTVRSSHLGLTSVDGCLPVACPRVKAVAATGFCRVCRLWWRGFAGLDDGEGEVLEFGEQRAEFFGVVEQWLPGGELFG